MNKNKNGVRVGGSNFGQIVAGSHNTVVQNNAAPAVRDASPPAPEKCKILFLAANPGGMTLLALDHEIREIEDKIRKSEHRDNLQLISKWAVRPDDLLQALNEHQPHIVHFSGHGSEANELLMLADDGSTKSVPDAAVRELFRVLRDNVRLVVLNACFSRGQAEGIVENVDCAIGMKKDIGDQAAIKFSAALYRAIGFGRSVQAAFEQARTSLMMESIREEDTPELLARVGVDPDGIVFV